MSWLTLLQITGLMSNDIQQFEGNGGMVACSHHETLHETALGTTYDISVVCAVQVAARLEACGHNRSLWPPAAKCELQSLQQQADTLQEQLDDTQAQLQATAQQLQQAQQLQALRTEAVAKAQEELMQVRAGRGDAVH